MNASSVWRRCAKVCVELRKPARTPSSLSASTWSCIRAIKGDTTTPTPGRTSDGIW